MKVLIACERSGVVREAFAARGHEAWSCDLEPSDRPGKHIQGDVLDLLGDAWDLMIAHPPCTHLAIAGARWFARKTYEQAEAIRFAETLMSVAHIPRIAIENPLSVLSTFIRKPDQIVQPWMFGDPYTKSTCLWLKGLPRLFPTQQVEQGAKKQYKGGDIPLWLSNLTKKDRARLRATTFPGMADAMAEQWGAPERLVLYPQWT